MGGKSASSQTNDNQAALAQQQAATQASLISAEAANNAHINADLGTAFHVPAPANMPSVWAVMGPSESAIVGSLTPHSLATAEAAGAGAVDPNETGLIATFNNSARGAGAGLSRANASYQETLSRQVAKLATAADTSNAAFQTSLAGQVGNLTTAADTSNSAFQKQVAAQAAASQQALAQEVGGGGQGVAYPLGPQVSYISSYPTDGSSSSSSSGGGLSPWVLFGALAIGGGGLWYFERRNHGH